MVAPTAPRILFIDAYDSFSNSIVGLLEETLHAEVHVIRIDDLQTRDELIKLIQNFNAVVIGPGPGHPSNAEDVGIARFLWTLSDAELLPVLGICLGFQSMCLAFGGKITRLRMSRHGHVSSIIHSDSGIFTGVGDFEATNYHSLHVTPPRASSAFDGERKCLQLIQPLAHTLDDVNRQVLMAAKIRTKPFWGIQFHPESICTSNNASRILLNWWELSKLWWKQTCRSRETSCLPNTPNNRIPCVPTSRRDKLMVQVRALYPWLFPRSSNHVNWKVRCSTGISIADVFEHLNATKEEAFLLDSQGHSSGRFSIIGLPQPGKKATLTFDAGRKLLTLTTDRSGQALETDTQLDSQPEVWDLIRKIMAVNAIKENDGPVGIPFWGGFIGWASYEAGLDTLHGKFQLGKTAAGSNVQDISFTWIARSVVIDHSTEQINVQQLGVDDDNWVISTIKSIEALSLERKHRPVDPLREEKILNERLQKAIIETPKRHLYCKQVEQCKDFLAAGESYELCLTDQTRIYLPVSSDGEASHDWELYKRLRSTNPAPFGAFIRTNQVTIVGSSPERFLSWSRSGKCQFRPIKGTVKKSALMDLNTATAILNSPKERAENLMIVDLIRHDLSGIVGSSNVHVPQLMQVEEYETVYQLVSVIEGQLDATVSSSGIDTLAASLPPGSMTGAPKKRSCELLSQLEHGRRGIYSGVLGYIDVGGGGDFSVVIRTAVKQRDEVVQRVPDSSIPGDAVPHHVWRVGAGGAVTIQSTSDGEFDEMETKLHSVLRAFEVE